MAVVTFFEKPGCQGNARQKALLEAAGHQVLARSLKGEPWTAETLLAFLAPLPVAEWFNRSAPAVKSGEIVPEQLSPEAALPLLLANPLLVRRPLMQVGDERRVGFDAAAVASWIGLGDAVAPRQDMEACVHGPEGHGRCHAPGETHAEESCQPGTPGSAQGAAHGGCGHH